MFAKMIIKSFILMSDSSFKTTFICFCSQMEHKNILLGRGYIINNMIIRNRTTK